MDQKRFPIGKVLMFGFISCGELIFYSCAKNIPVGIFTLTYLQHITGENLTYEGFQYNFSLIYEKTGIFKGKIG